MPPRSSEVVRDVGQRDLAARKPVLQVLDSSGFGLFGSVEFETRGFSPLLDWASVLRQVEKERALYSFCGSAGAELCPPLVRRWRDEIARLAPLPRHEQLRQLNRFANHVVSYASDSAAYDQRDHWASPLQFLQSAGDCEDFAVLKFFSLLELGFRHDQLRIAIVLDRQRQIQHAVVTVQVEGATYVLDNLFDHPVAHHHMLKYVPIYSFNLTTQWAHVVTPRIRAKFVAKVAESLAGRDVPGQPHASPSQPSKRDAL